MDKTLKDNGDSTSTENLESEFEKPLYLVKTLERQLY